VVIIIGGGVGSCDGVGGDGVGGSCDVGGDGVGKSCDGVDGDGVGGSGDGVGGDGVGGSCDGVGGASVVIEFVISLSRSIAFEIRLSSSAGLFCAYTYVKTLNNKNKNKKNNFLSIFLIKIIIIN